MTILNLVVTFLIFSLLISCSSLEHNQGESKDPIVRRDGLLNHR